MTFRYPLSTMNPTNSPPAMAELTMREVTKDAVEAEFALLAVFLHSVSCTSDRRGGSTHDMLLRHLRARALGAARVIVQPIVYDLPPASQAWILILLQVPGTVRTVRY